MAVLGAFVCWCVRMSRGIARFGHPEVELDGLGRPYQRHHKNPLWRVGSGRQQRLGRWRDRDDPLSPQVTNAIGRAAVTALTAGDVASEAFGDLVIAQGWKSTVLRSQLNGFVPVWSATFGPVPICNTTINAIAVGWLDSTLPPDKPLDIVTTSSSGYNAINEHMMYLHAFSPQ